MSYKDYDPHDLARADFKIHQLEGLEKDNVLNAFAGYVDDVLGKINDGKEATVYLCQSRDEYLAAKIYRARHFRHFDTDRTYRNFSKMRDRRMAKAMRGKSKRGQHAFHTHWIDSEWKILQQLHEIGVSVPKPYLQSADGILMEYIGNENGPAPRLVNCRLQQEEAESLLPHVIEDLELMIENDVVHGDFSAYNILYDGSVHRVIDVPQAVDPRVTPDAYNLFQRDLINIEKYFAKYGLTLPIDDLMRRYF
jgi:RIO kinase 1